MSDKKSSTTFTYNDPGRTFDGTPYEAAGKSVLQTMNVLKLLQRALQDTAIQSRNAYMQRQLETTGKPNAEGWESAPEYRVLHALKGAVKILNKKLTALHRAVSYDPNNPPKE
jgi:hypothetical protein